MIEHEELSEHLREAGFTIKHRQDLVGVNGRIRMRTKKTVYVAESIERGVLFNWTICTDCIISRSSHVHLLVSVRTAAGARFPHHDLDDFIPADFDAIDTYRGAPSKRTKIDKKSIPEPFPFRQISFVKNGNLYKRSMVIMKAQLLGPVGITDAAKVDEDMIAVPGEPVWWHFSCHGPSSATFNLITDGEVWHPVSRRTGRITTQLKPKRSVNLTNISTDDQSFLVHIINEWCTKATHSS